MEELGTVRARVRRLRTRTALLENLIREYAEHQSVRCGWSKGYGQWQNGNCPCGLTHALREAHLPVEWAGGPPDE